MLTYARRATGSTRGATGCTRRRRCCWRSSSGSTSASSPKRSATCRSEKGKEAEDGGRGAHHMLRRISPATTRCSSFRPTRSQMYNVRQRAQEHRCEHCQQGATCPLCGEKCIRLEPPVLMCQGPCSSPLLRSTRLLLCVYIRFLTQPLMRIHPLHTQQGTACSGSSAGASTSFRATAPASFASGPS